MRKANSHIISDLKWDTTSGQRERASEVQERLSSWSRITLPGEIMAVFDELCPPEQSWRIQTLEIDLGPCDFNDLEFELNIKIRGKLREKLIDLINNRNNNNANKLEVFSEEASILENLIYFLLTGVWPWNQRKEQPGINQLLAEQLLDNLDEVTDRIKKTAQTHEQVRKRIAWQFSEVNLRKIIIAIEPNNHIEIIDFSTVMANLQAKETVVQTGLASFKHNLWFWILNYLFAERGTLFNKLAFIKSSLLQMANHYNISFFELIDLIERSLNKMTEKTRAYSDFILVLKIITKEYQINKVANTVQNTIVDHWYDLEQQLNNNTKRKSTAQKNRLAELISRLSNENITKFRILITALDTSETFWILLIKDLEESSLKTIFSVLCPSESSLYIETIQFLNILSGSIHLKTNTAQIWEMGILFLLSNRTVSSEALLLFCISELSKQNKLNKEQLLERLTSAKIPSSTKNSNTLQIYSSISTAYCAEISTNNSDYPIRHFKDILHNLGKQLVSSSNKKEVFFILQRSFMKSIQLYPKMAFDIMMSYPDKELLKKLLPSVLNSQSILLLVKNANTTKSRLILTIRKIYTDLNKKRNLPSHLLMDELLFIGLEGILLYPTLNTSVFLENILKGLLSKISNSHLEKFSYLTDKLLKSKELSTYNISINKITLKNLFKGFIPTNTTNIVKTNPDKILPTNTQEDKNNRQLNSKRKARLQTMFESIEKSLSGIETSGQYLTQYDLKRLINLCLELHPQQFRKILEKVSYSDTALKTIKSTVLFSNFTVWIMDDVSGEIKQILNILQYQYEFIGYFIKDQQHSIFNKYWEHTWKLMLTKNVSGINPEKLFADSLAQLCREKNVDLMWIRLEIKKHKIVINPIISDILNIIIGNSPLIKNQIRTTIDDILDKKPQRDQLEKWCFFIILQKQIPVVLGNSGYHDIKEILNKILSLYPQHFFKVIKYERIPEAHWEWLSNTVIFEVLCSAISKSDRNKESFLRILGKFHIALGTISINGISSRELQSLLSRKLMNVAANDSWKIISIKNIWSEVLWDICTKNGISKKSFLHDIEKQLSHFPASLQLSFNILMENEKETYPTGKKIELEIKPVKIMTNNYKNTMKEGILVRNSGIVLLSSYIGILFDRLHLTTDKKFTTTFDQINAVHYLQYLITGLSSTEETLLPLNKVLCGMPIAHTVPNGIEISEEEKKLIDGLIIAAISHWSVIGNCSIDGFRGNWLVRDGLLLEMEDRWELTVEKKPMTY